MLKHYATIALRNLRKHRSFFRVFDFELLAGDAAQVLASLEAVVLTASTAQRYFSDEDPLGQTIRVGDELELEVRGVMADTPDNSHLQIDFLASMAALKRMYRYQREFTSYWWPWLWTYVKLTPSASAPGIKAQMVAFNERHRKQSGGEENVPQLQPLTDIHLYSNTAEDPTPSGSITYITILSAISLLILFIACINFTNLSLARSVQRAKEVGIRKTVGANLQQLLLLFNKDFIRLILIAFVVAIPITYYAMNRWLQDFAYHIDIGVAVFAVAGLLCLAIALATVSYQSFRAAWVNPVDALRNE